MPLGGIFSFSGCFLNAVDLKIFILDSCCSFPKYVPDIPGLCARYSLHQDQKGFEESQMKHLYWLLILPSWSYSHPPTRCTALKEGVP